MANVDVRELEKFSELAHQWWDPHGKFKPLHEINPLRLRHIDDVARLAGRVVLDVGCGGGLLSEAIAAQGARVTGIDLSERSLQVARLHLLESGLEVEYLNVSAEAFATQRPQHYDVVTCMEMLEHVPDPASVVQACARLVKPGGLLFFATISRNLKSYLFAILGAEYVLGLLPRGTHDYARFIRPSELAAMCRSADLEVEGVVGMTYNPLTREYALVPDGSVNYILHCRSL